MQGKREAVIAVYEARLCPVIQALSVTLLACRGRGRLSLQSMRQGYVLYSGTECDTPGLQGKREAVIAVYEAKPLISDHKVADGTGPIHDVS